MQSVSSRFSQLQSGSVRPMSFGLWVSFDKQFDDAIQFFTLDESLFDGPDLLAPEDSTVLSPWDKYEYYDYTDRVISMELVREETKPYSVTQAYADITLNNYDGLFDSGPLGPYLLPGRPMRIFMGINGENLPQFVGTNPSMPEVDKESRTVSFHLIDFLSWVLEKDITETVTLENYKTWQILEHLFTLMGLLPTQYVLDESYNNEVKFFYVTKGSKFKNVVHDLIGADMGRLYLDELGVIQFKNKFNFSNDSVVTLSSNNIVGYETSLDSSIINSATINADVRGVTDKQSVWKSSAPYRIKAGESLQVWGQFQDPVTTASDPVYSSIELSDSYYMAALEETNTTPYSDIALTDVSLFSTTVLFEFENIGAQDAYITVIDYWGTPAKVTESIKVEEKDQTSIDALDREYPYEMSNPYIQSRTDAVTIALLLIYLYASVNSVIDIEIKGSPALQINDPVTVEVDGFTGLYGVTKITNIMADSKFTQKITVAKRRSAEFFTLSSDTEARSLLDGDDILAP